jgi:hypothetical protein
MSDPNNATPVASENTSTTTAAPQAAPATPPTQPDSNQQAFAALASRERELRQAQESFKKDRDAYLSAVESEKKEMAAWKKSRDNARRDPLGYLKAAGLEYDQVSQAVLNDGKPSADLIALDVEQKLEQARAEWKAEMESERQKLADERKANDAAVVDRWKKQTADWVASQADKFELVNHYGLGASVADAIQKAWDENQEELTREAAAERLENTLRESVSKLKATKFWATLMETKPADAKPATDQRVVSAEKKPAAPDLTNRASAMPTTNIADGLSPAQRWEALKKSKGIS